MPAVLIEPDGRSSRLTGFTVAAEPTLREHGAEGDVVCVNLKDEVTDFSAWMGVDPAMPVNPTARQAIVNLTGLHLLCFGPVLITGLDEDTATEIAGG
jgi:hypothetical protein